LRRRFFGLRLEQGNEDDAADRARALVGVVALVGAAGAHAVTLPPHFQEGVAFSGLDNPTAVRFAPDGRVFVAEKTGRIVVYSNVSDRTPTLFADLSTNVYNYWDRGLLGLALALAPAFPADPHVYVAYTYDGDIGGVAPTGERRGSFPTTAPTRPATAASSRAGSRSSKRTATRRPGRSRS
jgi:glucose/arabinose dehydrogenase